MRTLPLVLLWWSILCATVAALGQTAPEVPAKAPYKDSSVLVEQRVADLLGRMTLEEKASMLAGSGWMESMPIERLGIPAIKIHLPMVFQITNGAIKDSPHL